MRAFRSLLLAGIVPLINIVFFWVVLWFGLNTDTQRKYTAELSPNKQLVGSLLQRLDLRAADKTRVRNFKTEFFPVLTLDSADAERIPEAEKARLLQEHFVKPLHYCLLNVHSLAAEAAAPDGSDPFSRAIAYLLVKTGTMEPSQEQFWNAVQRGEQHWLGCLGLAPHMGVLLRSFRNWNDLLDTSRRDAFATRVKAMLDQLFLDNTILITDRTGGSSTELQQAYEQLEQIRLEIKGRCLGEGAAAEAAALVELAEYCRQARDAIVRSTDLLWRLMAGISLSIETPGTERRTVEEVFRVYRSKVLLYFVLVWIGSFFTIELSARWKRNGGSREHLSGGENLLPGG